ncbi:hypothetical protein FHX44_112208 [Pseudonocardia hierapolitana]|uniref:Uncharacterized protein n=1 Tax=Pseudonocardia hierapolitana TaxID=1128676 RepID=A0A561SN84_9PSEU|nr:hypothetical protein [Pseudonocardia hierapolitana]TWF76318.1 hypothetical protein FHX44_112208 [Pseudonocardia hierapolitana]
MGRSRALRRAPEPRVVRLLRGVSGVLAGGLVALAVGLLVAGIVAQQRAVPGPGALAIGGHALAAAVAVLVQRRADRTAGAPAAGAALGVVALTVVVLGAQWLV